MPSQPASPLLTNALAIDPVWLHAPRFAMVRDLGYPIPVKQF